MREFHHIKITAGKFNADRRVEIDGRELCGVMDCTVYIDATSATRVEITLSPQVLEIEGDVHVDDVDIDREVRLPYWKV